MPRLAVKQESPAAQRIKVVAQRLFAERGVDGVTVREIAEAAGQKNNTAVGYHFGSKEALIRELVVDGAARIEERRNRMLDEMERGGGPHSIRQIVDVLIYPALDIAGPGEEESYNRFFTLLNMTHQELFMDALAGKWNSGYLRCLQHLRRLMPKMSPARMNQRFIFLGAYLGGVMSAREARLVDDTREHKTWSSDKTLDHFAKTVVALLETPD